MNFVRLLPVLLSFLLIAAHFQRSGNVILTTICVLFPLLLCFPRPWSIRIVQTAMYLSAIEWVRTLLYLVNFRQEAGLPWLRLALIIGTVALFTAASTLLFRNKHLKKKYNLT